jgi:hypothetical protein
MAISGAAAIRQAGMPSAPVRAEAGRGRWDEDGPLWEPSRFRHRMMAGRRPRQHKDEAIRQGSECAELRGHAGSVQARSESEVGSGSARPSGSWDRQVLGGGSGPTVL